MKYLVLCAIWIIWCFQHSFFTGTKVNLWFRDRLGPKYSYYRISYNLLSLVTVLPLVYWMHVMDGPVVIRISPFLKLFKFAAVILGAAMVAGSFFTFDIWEFAGLRQLKDRVTKGDGRETKKEHKHVISKHGLYGIVRHPMYLGGCIFFLALTAGAPASQFLGCLILAVYMIVGTVREDRRLARELGDTYKKYQKQVPMFLPKIITGGK